MIIDIFDADIFKNNAIVLGTFDGVHIGHTKLISKAVDFANKNCIKSVAFTFANIPSGAKELIPLIQKCKIIEDLGIDYVYVQQFDDVFKNTSYIDFLNIYLKDAYYVGTGYNFTFGKNCLGNSSVLEKFCMDNKIIYDMLNKVTYENEVVSSTRIRELIKQSDFDKATLLLGKNYFIEGKVVYGDEIGNTIGFPTANLEINNLALEYGVYATVTEYNGKKYKSITNYGGKPTVKHVNDRIETYLIDFNGNLYGETIKISFVKKLRDTVKFNSIDDLKNQLEKDTNSAKEIINNI